MPFSFRKYGTFTGPGVDIEYRDNDDFSLDPFDGYFNLNDVFICYYRACDIRF